MRLIDADQFGVVSFQGKSEDFIEGALFILDKIYEAPTIEQRPHGEWIPCSERLPEKNGVYLVTGENGHVFEYDYSDFTTHNEKWSYCKNEIVAWMPLPESYKEKSEGVTQ